MNKLNASVASIQSTENLSIVSFKVQAQEMSMVSLGLNIPIKLDSQVVLGFKANSVALAKEFSGVISTSNQLKCIVKSIRNGELLSSIKLSVSDEIIESVITYKSALKMNLQVGDEVIALVKANELSILEVQV